MSEVPDNNWYCRRYAIIAMDGVLPAGAPDCSEQCSTCAREVEEAMVSMTDIHDD